MRALFFVDFSHAESKTVVDQVVYLAGSLGHPAVMVFFVLSGYWVGGGAIRAIRRDSFTWSGYLSARLTRLWIVLIPAVLLTQVLDRIGTAFNGSSGIYTGDPAYHTVVPVGGAVQFLGLPETIGNLLFLQSLWVAPVGTNTPLWSLAYEFWFYLMFPALLLVFARRRKMPARLAAAAVLLIAGFIAGPKVLALLPIWVLGALLAWQRERVGQWLRLLPSVGQALARSVAVLATVASAAASTYFEGRLPGADYIVGAASLFLVAAFVTDSPRAQSLYPLAKAANWSYSLYAFHLPILAFFSAILVPQPELRWQLSPVTAGFSVLVLAVTFLFAYGLSLLTEARTEGLRTIFKARRRLQGPEPRLESPVTFTTRRGGSMRRELKGRIRWDWIGLAVIAVVALAVAGFALVRPATPAPVSDQVKDYKLTGPAQPFQFTAIGDSYTGGSPMGGSRGTPSNWVLHAATTIRAKSTPVLENESGIGGSGYVNRGPNNSPTFGEKTNEVINGNTDVVVFFGSINDMKQPLNEITSAADKAWTDAKVKAPDAQIIIVGPAWMRRDIPDSIDAITQSLKALAARHEFEFVDPDAERWFLDKPDLIGSDGTHPIDAGHVLMADKLVPHIEAAIARKGKPSREF